MFATYYVTPQIFLSFHPLFGKDEALFLGGVVFLTVLGLLVYRIGLSLVNSKQKLTAARSLATRYGVALTVAFALAFYGDWWDVIPWCWCGW